MQASNAQSWHNNSLVMFVELSPVSIFVGIKPFYYYGVPRLNQFT